MSYFLSALSKVADASDSGQVSAGFSVNLTAFAGVVIDSTREADAPVDPRSISRAVAAALLAQLREMDVDSFMALIDKDELSSVTDLVSGRDMLTVAFDACEKAGVELSPASEPEIEGMWDWRHSLTGDACPSSLQNKAEAALDAIGALGVEVAMPDAPGDPAPARPHA